MLAENDLGGVLLNSQHNFAWATAGASNGIDLSRENGAATLLIRNDGKKFIITNRIEMPRMLAEEVSENEFEPVDFAWEDEKASPTFLTDLAASLLNNGEKLASDIFLSSNAQTIESQIARCRYQLTEPEIERFRNLGKDAGELIGDLIKNLSPGISEKEIARKVIDVMATRGIRSIVTLVAADERIAKFRHPVPTDKIWEKVLMIVVCAQRGGLIASLTRIICAGNIPEELARKTEACARVNAKILSATKPNAIGAEIFKIIADAYAAEGFPGEEHLHHQGGAAGYKTRDWTAHPKSRETVQVNQAFAWNPSITGTKNEETIIVSADGIEIISATPDFPVNIFEIDGREYFSPAVLSL